MKSDKNWVKKCMEFRVDGRRPRRSWLESVEADMTELDIDKEDVHDRKKWRRNVMKSIGAEFFFTNGCPSWRQPHAWDAMSNSSNYNILAGPQPIQLYKFVCTIPTQNNNINLCSKPPFSRLLRHTWVKAVMLFYSYITR